MDYDENFYSDHCPKFNFVKSYYIIVYIVNCVFLYMCKNSQTVSGGRGVNQIAS